MGLIGILRGDAQAPEKGRASCVWGALAFRSEAAVGALLDRLVEAGLFVPRELDNGGTVLDLTPAGRAALKDTARLAALAQPAPPPTTAHPVTAPHPGEESTEAPPDPALFERLRAWRRQVAQEIGMPPYIVAHDTVLRRIAAARPRDEAALSTIKGIGPRKLARYGAAILAVVNKT